MKQEKEKGISAMMYYYDHRPSRLRFALFQHCNARTCLYGFLLSGALMAIYGAGVGEDVLVDM